MGNNLSQPIDHTVAHQRLADFLTKNPYSLKVKGFTMESDTFLKLKEVYDNYVDQGIPVDLIRFYFGYEPAPVDRYSLSVVAVINGKEDDSCIQSAPIAPPSAKTAGPCPPICDTSSNIYVV
jgi:hypothetical protein